MAKARTEKFSSRMSKRLLDNLRQEAKRSGQPIRLLLESAVKHYPQVVLPSWRTVRLEVVKHLDESLSRHNELLKRLAKSPRVLSRKVTK